MKLAPSSLLLFINAMALIVTSVSAEDPTVKVMGNNWKPASSFPLKHCQGDCDYDKECAPGLICYEREAVDLVPGCSGGFESRTDFCVKPEDVEQLADDGEEFTILSPPTSSPTYEPTFTPTFLPTSEPTSVPTFLPTPGPSTEPTSSTTFTPESGLVPLEFLGSNPDTTVAKLELCQGDCDTDADCASGLVCFQRNATDPVPGCSGGEHDPSQADYCVQTSSAASPTSVPTSSLLTAYPTEAPLVPLDYLESNPDTSINKLGLCQGDCDSNGDCAGDLICHQRGAGDPVPGCSGVEQDPSQADYCVAPPPPTLSPTFEGQENSHTLLNCEGPCIYDSDCVLGFSCFEQPGSTPVQVPGCPNLFTNSISTGFCVDEKYIYAPGHLTVSKAGLLLSSGLDARLVARKGQRVDYANGDRSAVRFHERPDAGATFPDTREGNEGGWVYVSNSEMLTQGDGGVGAITFDKDGNVQDYKMILEDTTWNCGGGRTPWNTWVSCEESGRGDVYQVDPFGVRPAQKLNLHGETGRYESFATDNRDPLAPQFFVTEDRHNGALTRIRPNNVAGTTDDPWSMLHGSVDITYLVLVGDGTFYWTPSREEGRVSAIEFYPDSEGIDFFGTRLFFICKKVKRMITLEMDGGTWTQSSTTSGAFDGSPDQIQRIVGDVRGDLLYFTEEGGFRSGIHARDATGNFYTVMEGPSRRGDETTGLAISPDARFMMVAFQDEGKLFEIWRKDGLPFHAHQLDIKYHAT